MNIQLVIPHRNGKLPRVGMEFIINEKRMKAIILSEIQGASDTTIFTVVSDSEFNLIQKEPTCEPSEKASII